MFRELKSIVTIPVISTPILCISLGLFRSLQLSKRVRFASEHITNTSGDPHDGFQP
jgi:hypothetical protein